jgi:hypothetical protein
MLLFGYKINTMLVVLLVVVGIVMLSSHSCRSCGIAENFSSNAGLDNSNNGEMLLFANTEFKPGCCPNTYSTGSGCACMTKAQLNLLNTRGGNNYPQSEY